MSFGYSVSDAFALGQLAWNAIQNARKACGEHDGLTREVSALHVALRRLEQEVKKPESPINASVPGDTCRQELQAIMVDCGKVLRVLDKILEKYNALGEKERSTRKIWQRIKFGNGEMEDLGDLRSKIILYTSSITFYLNMVSMGTVGRIEQEMNKSGGILREIQLAVNDITTQFISRNNYEGSVFTTYADDDKSVWREFRRELRKENFTSSVLHKHKNLILDYIKELGSRGLLDDQDPQEFDEWLIPEQVPAVSTDAEPSDPFISNSAEKDLPNELLRDRRESLRDVLKIPPISTSGTATGPRTKPSASNLDEAPNPPRDMPSFADQEEDEIISESGVSKDASASWRGANSAIEDKTSLGNAREEKEWQQHVTGQDREQGAEGAQLKSGGKPALKWPRYNEEDDLTRPYDAESTRTDPTSFAIHHYREDPSLDKVKYLASPDGEIKIVNEAMGNITAQIKASNIQDWMQLTQQERDAEATARDQRQKKRDKDQNRDTEIKSRSKFTSYVDGEPGSDSDEDKSEKQERTARVSIARAFQNYERNQRRSKGNHESHVDNTLDSDLEDRRHYSDRDKGYRPKHSNEGVRELGLGALPFSHRNIRDPSPDVCRSDRTPAKKYRFDSSAFLTKTTPLKASNLKSVELDPTYVPPPSGDLRACAGSPRRALSQSSSYDDDQWEELRRSETTPLKASNLKSVELNPAYISPPSGDMIACTGSPERAPSQFSSYDDDEGDMIIIHEETWQASSPSYQETGDSRQEGDAYPQWVKKREEVVKMIKDIRSSSSTPAQELKILSQELEVHWIPQCLEFLNDIYYHPPKLENGARKLRITAYKKLSESILQQVMLKLDGIQIQRNPQLRILRKALVTQTQDWLTVLDEERYGSARCLFWDVDHGWPVSIEEVD